MNRLPEIIGLILWLVLLVVSVIFEEGFSKRLPLHMLRFHRYLAVLGLGMPFMSGWVIYELLCASDWEKMKLFYLLLVIPFMALFGIGGMWMLLHALNWGIDIKEDRIVYRNIFSRTRTIYFTEITGIEHREPRFGKQNRRRSTRLFDLKDWIIELISLKEISSYRIYIGRRSIQVDSIVCNYNGSAARILKAMKKQGVQRPVTTKKTWFS